MDEHQIKAQNLFIDGDYAQAKAAMAQSTSVSPQEFKQFVSQCNQMIAEQYRFLIEDALKNGNTPEARRLKEEFVRENGKHELIEAIPGLPSITTHVSTPVSSPNQPSETCLVRNPDNRSSSSETKIYHNGFFWFIVVVVFAIIIAVWATGHFSKESSSDTGQTECVEDSLVPVEDEYLDEILPIDTLPVEQEEEPYSYEYTYD